MRSRPACNIAAFGAANSYPFTALRIEMLIGDFRFRLVWYMRSRALVTASALGIFGVLACMAAIGFVLGFLIDSISIIILTVPVFAPIARAIGFDPLAVAILGILAI